MARTKKNPKRRRRARRNPSGGFLPAVAGFLVLPILDGLAARASVAVSAPAIEDPPPGVGVTRADMQTMAVAGRGQLLDVGAAVVTWASLDRVKDPGWHSFLRGGMWGAIVSALIRPLATAYLVATQREPITRTNDQNPENVPAV